MHTSIVNSEQSRFNHGENEDWKSEETRSAWLILTGIGQSNKGKEIISSGVLFF